VSDGESGKIQKMRTTKRKNGLQMLLKQGRKKFRIAENLDYYAAADFKAAERKFLKECIINDRCRM
jgi:hypothetical protein